ncbi:MAG: RHS repeat-associated core domain-containing protein, partial [Akkermansia sp.]
MDQPFQWSSEVYDAELGMVYYNYRHYNPSAGRWIGRDPIEEKNSGNLYQSYYNSALAYIDYLGLAQILTDMTNG